jgi:hypothetical protein
MYRYIVVRNVEQDDEQFLYKRTVLGTIKAPSRAEARELALSEFGIRADWILHQDVILYSRARQYDRQCALSADTLTAQARSHGVLHVRYGAELGIQ